MIFVNQSPTGDREVPEGLGDGEPSTAAGCCNIDVFRAGAIHAKGEELVPQPHRDDCPRIFDRGNVTRRQWPGDRRYEFEQASRLSPCILVTSLALGIWTPN